MPNSKGFWVFPEGKIQDIGFCTHIEFLINNSTTFNITIEKITALYASYGEQIPCEGIARKIIIMDLLDKGYIRIRQYRNNFSISIKQLDDATKSSLSKWAEIAMTIPNSGKYADCIIQNYTGEKVKYSIQQLYSKSY